MQLLRLPLFRLAICLVTIYEITGHAVLSAQTDTIMMLEEVEVTARRIILTDIGKHTDKIDSQALVMGQFSTLSGVLGMHTPLYVRSYGNGTLATLGVRGGSAAHTQLLWNGIPLRNPMLGLVDLALIPSFFTDEVSVHYGGHGAAFGSGAVGGLISLTNDPVDQDDNVSMHLSLGSWQSILGELKANYGFKKLRFSSRLFYQTAENNYRYKLSKDAPERNQIHHQLENYGILQEARWTINTNEHMTARIWYQHTDRQIPPTSTQTNSKSAQQDESLRASLEWMRTGEKFSWQLKTSWIEERIDFQDSLILLYTHNQFRTWLAEAETAVRIAPGVSLAAGIYTEHVRAESVNYDEGTSRGQYAAFTSIGIIRNDWVWRFQMREEVTDTKWSPLLVDLSAEWSAIRNITIKSSLSRNYRTPTLNDLHWNPGGNPDLLPEQGWTFETGIHTASKGDKTIFSSSLTGYIRSIDQWIMWVPPIKDVRNYWSPLNIAEVNSHGLEARGNLEVIQNAWHFNVNAGIDFTWSTFGAPLPDFMISEGDQLFYVPVENVLAGLNISNSQWSGYYRHHWFGDSPGINEDVKAGNVGSAGVNFNFTQPKLKWTLYLQADNIWNVPYRIIERRPMPGRSFIGGVRFSFT